jgi:N-acetylglutamate synthase-like GNAT family acetyltransferase
MRERAQGVGSPVSRKAPHLTAFPLATWEREGLKAALNKAGLPIDDVESPDRLFWRFETAGFATTEFSDLQFQINPPWRPEPDLVPVGFGGLEIYGEDALMRSVVTLPPVRRHGVGTAIVAILEVEGLALGCRTIWLLTASNGAFFERLGYTPCERARAPKPIRTTQQFAALCPASAVLMVKRLK